jgi:hypothetical protein
LPFCIGMATLQDEIQSRQLPPKESDSGPDDE